MITTSRLFRNSLKLVQNLRFNKIQESKSVVSQNEGTSTTHPEEIPVYLRPYDKNKYEVPSTKLKVLTINIQSE